MSPLLALWGHPWKLARLPLRPKTGLDDKLLRHHPGDGVVSDGPPLPSMGLHIEPRRVGGAAIEVGEVNSLLVNKGCRSPCEHRWIPWVAC
jgi:hypothetical protein